MTHSTIPSSIAVAYGDGIGPEIMTAVLDILDAAGANLDIHTIEVGEDAYKAGHQTGIPDSAWDTIQQCKTVLKAPITTPRGKGYKSLNVTMRKALGLFANIRPNVAFHPFISTHFPDTDLIIIRENEEGLYAGIEHQQTADVTQALKLISRTGSERIIRYAFEYATTYGRQKVTCMVKDNIMKITDGLFAKVFEEVAADYPDIDHESVIVDIGSARIGAHPDWFDVVVAPNLYGDILSDIAAEVVGSVGVAGSANIGADYAVFEAVHGSAPDIAGEGVANPSGLLNGAIMMLSHLGQFDVAQAIQNAWGATIENGIHTRDIYDGAISTRLVNTAEFASAVIDHLGDNPAKIKLPPLAKDKVTIPPIPNAPGSNKTLVGVDLFYDRQCTPEQLADILQDQVADAGLELEIITNRGMSVWPTHHPATVCVDHWRCRFTGQKVTARDITTLVKNSDDAGLDLIKMEKLYKINGEKAYSAAAG